MLASITKKRTEEWLIQFIRNSQRVIATGDEYANFLYKEYDQHVMPSFKELSDKQITNILYYIKSESLHPQDAVNLDNAVLQNGNAEILKGKQLFQNQCSPCHFIEKENLSQGPALGSVAKRRPKAWLVSFIKNSQEVIKQGDPYAVYLFNSFDRRVMVPMEFLSNDDISSILDYITFASASSHAEAGGNGRVAFVHPVLKTISNITAEEKEGQSLFKILFLIIAPLGFMVHLFLIVKLFTYLSKEKGS
jgi:mono/diheme cytochrome c family protein